MITGRCITDRLIKIRRSVEWEHTLKRSPAHTWSGRGYKYPIPFRFCSIFSFFLSLTLFFFPFSLNLLVFFSDRMELRWSTGALRGGGRPTKVAAPPYWNRKKDPFLKEKNYFFFNKHLPLLFSLISLKFSKRLHKTVDLRNKNSTFLCFWWICGLGPVLLFYLVRLCCCVWFGFVAMFGSALLLCLVWLWISVCYWFGFLRFWWCLWIQILRFWSCLLLVLFSEILEKKKFLGFVLDLCLNNSPSSVLIYRHKWCTFVSLETVVNLILGGLGKVLVKDNFGQGILDIFRQKRKCASKREGYNMLCFSDSWFLWFFKIK